MNTRKLFYQHFIQFFWLQNNNCEFLASTHKFKRLFCNRKPAEWWFYKYLIYKSDFDFVWWILLGLYKIIPQTTQIFKLLIKISSNKKTIKFINYLVCHWLKSKPGTVEWCCLLGIPHPPFYVVKLYKPKRNIIYILSKSKCFFYCDKWFTLYTRKL